jgi:4-hydroxy-2-oxoheptanedioate aldolase
VLTLPDVHSAPPGYVPKRVNKAIELLEAGQPVYYVGGHGGYEEGKRMARTWADYINYEMEHGPFDVQQLRDFMQGLVDGGPTRSGHRTPAVIVTLPVLGYSEAHMRANYWVAQQVLAAGVHGILLCHARDPEAVRVFVAACRYPFHKQAVGNGLEEGLRGNGSQGFASRIWGVSPREYLTKADPWPLNPQGELLLGLKIEDRHALQNAEASTKAPGIGFAEWGPGDMGMSFGYLDRHDPPYPKEMVDARSRVLAATKAANIAFLSTIGPDDYQERIAEGVRIGAGIGEKGADLARRSTKRQMPW